MSKPNFEVWAREAERMRDEALAEDEMARDKAAHEQIVRRLTEGGHMQQELLDKHYLRKHGKNAYYGQN